MLVLFTARELLALTLCADIGITVEFAAMMNSSGISITTLPSLVSLLLDCKEKTIDELSWTIGFVKEAFALMKEPGVKAEEAIITAVCVVAIMLLFTSIITSLNVSVSATTEGFWMPSSLIVPLTALSEKVLQAWVI